MAVLTNTMMQGTAAISDEDGYQIENNLRFNSGDSPSLVCPISASGHRDIWTWSGWVKRNTLGTTQAIFNGGEGSDGNDREGILFLSDDTLVCYWRSGGTENERLGTTQKFRDPSAWMHIVWAFDYNVSGTSSTGKSKVYVNGKLITDWDATFSAAVVRKINERGQSFWFGKTPAGDPSNLQLANVQFIDGIALSPAAFGEFDSNTGVWNPKAFALPTPNDGTTWSDSVSGTAYNSDYAKTKAFDGLISADQGNTALPADNSTLTFTPSSPIEAKQGIRVSIRRQGNGNVFKWNGQDISAEIIGAIGSNSTDWYTMPTRTLTSMAWSRPGDANDFRVNAIEVDGVILVDGQTDPTNEDWINQPDFSHTSSLSATGGGSFSTVNDATQCVTGGGGTVVDDWVTYTRVSPATGTFKWTVPSHIQAINCKRLRFFIYVDANNASSAIFKLNGSVHAVTGWSGQNFFGWVEFTNPPSTLTSLEYSANSTGISLAVKAIEFNGVILQNNIGPEGKNGFHLKFDDTSTNRNLGTDSINGKLANANGALPIYNTKAGATDNEIDYGDVKDTGYRADSSAGTTASTGLLLAVPGDSVASGTCDVHQAINTGESNKAATVTGAKVSTDESRFYGSSLYFDGVDDIIKFPGTALGTDNFTIECWAKLPSSNYGTGGYSQLVGNIASNAAGYWRMGSLFNGSPNFWFAFSSGSYNDIMSGVNIHDDKWHHLAVVRTGTGDDQLKMYVDGIFVKAHNCAQDLSQTEDWRLMASDQAGGFCRSKGYIQDVRVYKGVAKYTTSFTPPTRNNFNVNGLWNADQQEIVGRVLISDATGAKPFWETTDDLGGTRSGTDVRSGEDTNLSWCLPFHESSGTPEYHNGNGIGSVSGGGSPSQSSDQSKFYGYSHYFPQNSRYSMSGPGGTFTWQAWCYFTNSGQQGFFSSQGSDNQGGTFRVSTSGYMGIWTKFGSSSHSAPNGIIPTNEWVHVAIQYDATNDIYKNFVNGEQKYSASETNNPGGSYELGTSYSGTNNYTLNGCYLSDVRMYSVAKYTADGFTVPKLGTTYDRKQSVFVDSPTSYLPTTGSDGSGGVTRGNYCTLNPLKKGSSISLSGGNLKLSSSGNHGMAFGTIGISSGKYYWEFETTSSYLGIGVAEDYSLTLNNAMGDHAGAWGYASNGSSSTKQSGDATHVSYGSACASGDVIGVAFDADNGTLEFYKNNSSMGVAYSGMNTSLTYFPIIGDCTSAGNPAGTANFGAKAFKYAAPAGYKCLCTQNLPDTFSGDQKNDPSQYFDIKTWTGNDVDDTDIKGFNFQPDLVWIKRRNDAGIWGVWDAIRGTNALDTAEDGTDTAYGTPPVGGYVSQFNSDGFRLKNGSTNNSYTHVDGADYAAWAWDAGAAAATPSTDGNITISNQWVNATAGFSITKYTMGADGGTFGHALGAKPDMILVKRLNSSASWCSWHKGIPNTDYMMLDKWDDKSTWNVWGNTDATNTLVTVSGDSYTGNNGDTYIAYCWTAIPGYSAFGIFDGTGSDTAGPFLYCGFRPKMVIRKGITEDGYWGIFDSVRETIPEAGQTASFNPINQQMYLDGTNLEGADASNWPMDFLSNGINIRGANHQYTNKSGNKYIWMAWAENPFKIARAV